MGWEEQADCVGGGVYIALDKCMRVLAQITTMLLFEPSRGIGVLSWQRLFGRAVESSISSSQLRLSNSSLGDEAVRHLLPQCSVIAALQLAKLLPAKMSACEPYLSLENL